MIQAIIFDMDGTLLDTERIYQRFWLEAMHALGYPMTVEQALAMRSLGRPFGEAQLKEWFGPEINHQAVREKRNSMMFPYLAEHGIPKKPGVEEVLAKLKEAGFTIAVATATNYELATKQLGEVGLLPYFDKVISAHMVKEGKPSPDVYLYACEQLGLAPENCMAVEDAPNGVLSAYRAGCKVVMVPDLTKPDEELEECLYACLESLQDIPKLCNI